MEIVVLVIMLLVCLIFLLKLTFVGWTARLVICFIAALFIFFSVDLASEQSNAMIEKWMSRQDIMLDVSVLIIVEVAFQVYFCLLAGAVKYEQLSLGNRVGYMICRYFPGPLFLPVLFAMLTVVLLNTPGADFDLIGISFASSVFLLIPLLAYGLERIISEYSLRLELIFMLSLLLAASGVALTIAGSAI